METFDSWFTNVERVWARVAPSYVQTHNHPVRGVMRPLYDAGVSVGQFSEALEVAFVAPGVTQRQALACAVRSLDEAAGVVR